MTSIADGSVKIQTTAAGSQRSSFNCWTRHHQTVRRPSRLCHLARVGDGLTPPLPTTRSLLLGPLCRSEWPLLACFPGFSSSSPFLAPHPADSPISGAVNVPF